MKVRGSRVRRFNLKPRGGVGPDEMRSKSLRYVKRKYMLEMATVLH